MKIEKSKIFLSSDIFIYSLFNLIEPSKMLDFEDFLKYIRSQNFYDDQISYIQYIPEKKAEFGKLNKPLHKRLEFLLKKRETQLWAHQAKSINFIREGKNTVISTSTASGKSLCYNLPVLESILEDPSITALYIFPTKALARDQYITLLELMAQCKIRGNRVGVYDGDVDKYEKRQILAEANIIITNPYGLHFYLPWFKRKWGRICQNLEYIILDEIHIYRGIFGSNFALLLRRLKRLLDDFKANPTWILSSATINNPKKFAEKLVGERFSLVDHDASPSGAKRVILWDLPIDKESGKYRSAHQETKNLFTSHLTYKDGIQTLTFTLSRKMAELQAIWTRESLQNLYNQIHSYRAGISKSKRREIERAFKNQEILGISSTNALELGIDIGSLDATILSGFPGTLSSFWQQIGRSGRGEELSLSTFVPMPNPLDLFYIHNPDILFGPIQEEILITLDNEYITKNHLCCAAKERPLTPNEYETFGLKNEEIYRKYLRDLEEDSLLMKRGKKYFWKANFYPNEKYQLSNLSDRTYEVILRKPTKDILLTTEDESYVFRDLHPGAVYLYEAETYLVQDLDLDEKKVYISRANVDFYTQSLKHTDISSKKVLNELTTGQDHCINAFFGNVRVEHEYYSYKVIDTLTQDIVSRKPLENIPIIEFDTQSFWFEIPFEFQKELELEGYDLGGTVHAIEHAMIAIAPALAQISRWDLGGVSIDFDPVVQKPVIYIYDAFRGGIGVSETLFYELDQLLTHSFQLIHSCNCKTDNGCPGCLMSPKCGNNNEPLDKAGALFLLKKLIKKT
ncbi:MAG: putative ATP-dependent helicase Lhr [Promethearchaeota archaeon]|nr:MAG: putative ATP-dependent helicase Lhr [Candidatus Lokiarchaeota archaeon]